MADDRKKPTKSESLTIRLDPKSRFMLEFISKARGQTITTVVERAITQAADQLHLDRNGSTWREFWDTIEGVRALQLAAEQDLFPTFEEERRLVFAQEHYPFFYTSDRMKTFRRYSTDILWPRIDEFIALHDRMKAQDYWAAGKAMAEALTTAGLSPPVWPLKAELPAPKSGPKPDFDLDDEIPF